MYRTASRHASWATSKQSDGLEAAITGIGHSPLRPNTACNKSACSVLVGKPVEGPPRCTLITIIGNSVMMARPMPSPLSAMPGPLLAVTLIAPANAAPIAAVIAAISSSAWNVSTSKFLCLASSSRMLLAGVIGYAPRNSRLPLIRAAVIRPYASAVLPTMLVYLPGASLAFGTWNCVLIASTVSP